MKKTRTNYNNYVLFLAITILLCLLPCAAVADTSRFQDSYGPQENVSYDPARFNYSKKTSSYLTKFKGQISKTALGDSGTTRQGNMNMEYGQLFSPSDFGYRGFSYLSAKIDSSSRIKFITSVGHFVEAIDGDLFFTYRLLGANQDHTLATLGTIDDRLYENSFAVSYTRYSDRFLRETSLNYSFSTIPGDEFSRQVYQSQPGTNLPSANIVGGYGDIMIHEIDAKVAFGYESLGTGFLRGLKTNLGLGYEYGVQNEVYNYTGEVNESLSLMAGFEHKAAFGLINTSYKYQDSSQTLYAGYSIQGIDLYIQETRYQDNKENILLGFLLKLNLWNPKDPLRKIKDLFGRNSRSKRGLEQIRQSVSLNSDSFSVTPKPAEFIDS
ncbi:hypothetical protein [Desulforhopalus sp. 52FAK]